MRSERGFIAAPLFFFSRWWNFFFFCSFFVRWKNACIFAYLPPLICRYIKSFFSSHRWYKGGCKTERSKREIFYPRARLTAKQKRIVHHGGIKEKAFLCFCCMGRQPSILRFRLGSLNKPRASDEGTLYSISVSVARWLAYKHRDRRTAIELIAPFHGHISFIFRAMERQTSGN